MKKNKKSPLIHKIEQLLAKKGNDLKRKYDVLHIEQIKPIQPLSPRSRKSEIELVIKFKKRINVRKFIALENYLKTILKRELLIISEDSLPNTKNIKATLNMRLFMSLFLDLQFHNQYQTIGCLKILIKKLEFLSKKLACTPFPEWKDIFLDMLRILSSMYYSIRSMAYQIKKPFTPMPKLYWPCSEEIKISWPRRDLIKAPTSFLKTFYSRKITKMHDSTEI